MTSNRISPARRAVLERRAAAARRRAVLTFSLFLVTIVVAVIGFNTALSAWFAVIPGALVAGVLVLGRRAVVANQRSDAAYAARQEQVTYAPRQMSATERRLAGRPVPAVRTGIPTAQAENVSTTVMARVESSMFAKKHITGTAVAPGVGKTTVTQDTQSSSAGDAATEQAASASGTPTVGGSAYVTERASAKVSEQGSPAVSSESKITAPQKSAAQMPAQAKAARPVPAPPAQPSNRQWNSVAVPAPVYTNKAAAPQWEPPGVTTELRKVTAQRMEQIAREAEAREIAEQKRNPQEQPAAAVQASASVPESDVAAADQPAADQPAAQTATPDSLGVNLNSILARRRAV